MRPLQNLDITTEKCSLTAFCFIHVYVCFASVRISYAIYGYHTRNKQINNMLFKHLPI